MNLLLTEEHLVYVPIEELKVLKEDLLDKMVEEFIEDTQQLICQGGLMDKQVWIKTVFPIHQLMKSIKITGMKYLI